MRFTYVNAGAPACVGDAGLFGRSRLSHQIREGLLTTENIPLYFESGEMKRLHPYLVGDALFPLGVHMMKSVDPVPGSRHPRKKVQEAHFACTESDRESVWQAQGHVGLLQEENMLEYTRLLSGQLRHVAVCIAFAGARSTLGRGG
jgi:hypothetical protein